MSFLTIKKNISIQNSNTFLFCKRVTLIEFEKWQKHISWLKIQKNIKNMFSETPAECQHFICLCLWHIWFWGLYFLLLFSFDKSNNKSIWKAFFLLIKLWIKKWMFFLISQKRISKSLDPIFFSSRSDFSDSIERLFS